MIDPNDVTKFDRSEAELQEFWLFACVVAGKTAKTQARLLEGFLTALPKHHTPFGRIERAYPDLYERLRESRLGQYNRLHKCFVESLKVDLRAATVEELERIHGIGPKTARFFLMHSRPHQRIATLDTHILKFLRANGIDAPLVTPSSSKTYMKLEQAFLKLADAAGKSPADYDLEIWRRHSSALGGSL
jgi:thermostable 8-oxoguanine DNA glycosylase